MTSKQKKIRDIERLLRRINAKSTPLLQPSSNSAIIDAETTEDGGGEPAAPVPTATTTKIGREEFRKTSKLKQKMDELENLKMLREESLRKVKERKNSVKYHLVRFLERKRVTRMICSIDSKVTKLEAATEPSSNSKERKKTLKLLQSQRSSLEKDLIYIMYYPMEYKYISLFAKSGEENKSEKNESVDSESKDDESNERMLSPQRNSPLSQKVRQLAEAAYRADRGDPDGNGDGNGGSNGGDGEGRPTRDRVQHAIDVAKNRRQQRQRQKLEDPDAAPPPGEKKPKRKAPSSSSPSSTAVDEEDDDATTHNTVVVVEPSEETPSTLTYPRKKKSKSDGEPPSQTAKASKPIQPSLRSSSAPAPAPTPVPAPGPDLTGDAFFMEESSEQDRAAADEEIQRRRQEHDRLRIGDLRSLRKKKYKHRSLFKKR